MAALVVGEAILDVVAADGRVVERAGGSAANVAVALARLGRPTWLATSFADDAGGRLLAAHLRSAGVRLATDPHVVAETATATATVGPDGAASYGFSLDWRLGPVTLPHGTPPQVVHACSLGAVLPPGAARVRALLARLRGRSTVSYDLNVRPTVTGTGPDVVRAVERLVASADVVKASDEDLAALYPGVAEDRVLRRLLRLGPVAVLLTRGGAGASALTARGTVQQPPVPVDVVDTIGAGDTFAAAALDRLWQVGVLGEGSRGRLAALDLDAWHAVLEHAGRAAAVTVSRAGADPPWRAELAGTVGNERPGHRGH